MPSVKIFGDLWLISGKLSTSDVISYTVVCVRESTKPILCSKWGHFDKAKAILKIRLASWTFHKVEKSVDL